MVNATTQQLYVQKRDTVPNVQEAGRATQGRSGRVWKISPPTGIRSPDRPARSESLYRLSYPGPYIAVICINNNSVRINDNYGRLQYLILLFKISMDTRNMSSKFCRQLGYAPSDRLASPGLYYIRCRIKY